PGARLPGRQPGADGLSVLPPAGVAVDDQSRGVDGEGVQPPGEGVGEVLERGRGRGDPPAPGGIPLRGWPPGPAPQGEALRTLPQLQNQEDWGGSVGRQNHEPLLTPTRAGRLDPAVAWGRTGFEAGSEGGACSSSGVRMPPMKWCQSRSSPSRSA